MSASKEYIPNRARAAINGKIATIDNGRRIVREYSSGDPLIGRLEFDDGPRFTGEVRGWAQRLAGKQ